MITLILYLLAVGVILGVSSYIFPISDVVTISIVVAIVFTFLILSKIRQILDEQNRIVLCDVCRNPRKNKMIKRIGDWEDFDSGSAQWIVYYCKDRKNCVDASFGVLNKLMLGEQIRREQRLDY